MVIETGDTIAVKSKHGFLAALTRFFTRSEYTHVGLAIWIDNTLWLSEINGGGNHLVPMSQFSEIPYDVYECPVNRDRVREAILSSLSKRINYGFAALAVIGLLDWLKINTFLHARRILVCSGYVVSVYEATGWGEHTRIISPNGLTKLLKLRT